jgi:hypothetical protein
VAGAAALLKQVRKGLTPDQYRSMLINSAPITTASQPVRNTGAGLLNASGAMYMWTAATPTSMSFGAGGGTFDISRDLVIMNVGTAPDVLTLTAIPNGDGRAPTFSPNGVSLDVGQEAHITVHLTGSNLADGEYQGFLQLNVTHTGMATRIPYWYAVTSAAPAFITVLDFQESGPTGKFVKEAFTFRITDAAGVPLPDVQPALTVTRGQGTVSEARSVDSFIPGAFTTDVTLGPNPGVNQFQISVGDLTQTVNIEGQ